MPINGSSLQPVVYARLKAGFDIAITALGTPVTITTADGASSVALLSGMRTVGKNDLEIVNAYGIDARIFTVRLEDITPIVPAEFDRVMVTHSQLGYTINAVHEIYLNDTIIGYKMIARADR